MESITNNLQNHADIVKKSCGLLQKAVVIGNMWAKDGNVYGGVIMKSCTLCGRQMPDEANFCPACGTPAEDAIPKLLAEDEAELATDMEDTRYFNISSDLNMQNDQAYVEEKANLTYNTNMIGNSQRSADQFAANKSGRDHFTAASAGRNVNPQYAPNQNIPAQNIPGQSIPKQKKSGDFTTAPTGINIISIIGFILSFLCLASVWISELSIIVFPASLIALVLCTIPKALKYNNVFSKVGFIVALVITIISAIVFGIHLNNVVYGTSWLF